MFSKIITVTLNPSLDTTIWVDKFDLSEPVSAKREQVYPGGKSINVSRVLTSLGVENKSIGIVGEDNAKRISDLLDLENISYDFIKTKGAIRENLSIILPDESLFKINRSGFSVSDDKLDLLKKKLELEIANIENVLVIFAGSLPKNVTREQYKSLIIQFNRKNTKVCIDTDILSEIDIKQIKPFIIKPNEIELSHIANRDFTSLGDIKQYAKMLSLSVEHVIISMGSKGIIYAGNEKIYSCSSPQVEVKSTVGAGDTTLAGFIQALNKGQDIVECVAYATACGTASVMIEGTGIITKQNADEMRKNISTIKS